MKTIVHTFMLIASFIAQPQLHAEGVGAGGSGGHPTAMGGDEGVITSFGLAPAKVVPSQMKRETTVIVPRAELLEAVGAALDYEDFEVAVGEETKKVRLQTFDIKRGILHGKVVETNRPIQLIDEERADSGSIPAVSGNVSIGK